MRTRPNVLFVMTDQQRFDTIAALGNSQIYTPNLDRLVRRGVSFQCAYSGSPVCVPARYNIRTGREFPSTRSTGNREPAPLPAQPQKMEDRCGPYLARTMGRLGYRTFGIGKFHPKPWNEDLGFDVCMRVEGLSSSGEGDAYEAWIRHAHPEYAFIEELKGERSTMYYVPQMRAVPAEFGMEWWAADRTIEQMRLTDGRPYFGFVSFLGPHPPFAPPIPFNRMYDPDRMPNPYRGDPAIDHMDDGLPRTKYAMWAEGVTDPLARILKARYWGEISYIDHCIGRILDAVEAGGNADNTLIAFFTDHGDMLGDHDAWQKSTFFEASCRIPFLVSWPASLKAGLTSDELVCLTDLFGIATNAAGAMEVRDGVDVLGIMEGKAQGRDVVLGFLGYPGQRYFKMMVRDRRYKYIFMANGARQQLFDLQEDPRELNNLVNDKPDVARAMRARMIQACRCPGAIDALEGDDMKVFEFKPMPLNRTFQFGHMTGMKGFTQRPEDVLKDYKFTDSPP